MVESVLADCEWRDEVGNLGESPSRADFDLRCFVNYVFKEESNGEFACISLEVQLLACEV